MDNVDKLLKLRRQGFFCSQILLLQGLEQMGKTNVDLIRSMNGLAGGLGFSGELCAALIGGAALLGLYAGKGLPEEDEDPRLDFMVQDLVNWFKAEYSEKYGGIRCEEIINGSSQNKAIRCPLLVSGVLQKVNELLVENGYDLSGLE
jgi:hypothetical protein